MPEMNDIVKLAVDAYHGKVEKYSVGQSMETLRCALVEANGGSTTLNYKNIRDGKCNGLFSLIETILSRTVSDGLQGNEFFNAMVEFRNVAEGDQNMFVVEDSNLFIVSEAADGTQGVRRQRLGGSTETPIPTSMKVVKIYEELNRVLSGRIDFNHFIDKVAESFNHKILDDVFTLWTGVTAEQLGGTTFFPNAGSYDEGALLDVIAHVEAAAGGKPATIVGTKKALRNLKGAIVSDSAKDDMYNMGCLGKFYGTNVMAVPQRHKPGTSKFMMPDNVLTIIAGDEKPIKFVYEGDPIVLMGDPMANADLTQEYLYGEKYGLGLVLANGNSGVGRYEMT